MQKCSGAGARTEAFRPPRRNLCRVSDMWPWPDGGERLGCTWRVTTPFGNLCYTHGGIRDGIYHHFPRYLVVFGCEMPYAKKVSERKIKTRLVFVKRVLEFMVTAVGNSMFTWNPFARDLVNSTLDYNFLPHLSPSFFHIFHIFTFSHFPHFLPHLLHISLRIFHILSHVLCLQELWKHDQHITFQRPQAEPEMKGIVLKCFEYFTELACRSI